MKRFKLMTLATALVFMRMAQPVLEAFKERFVIIYLAKLAVDETN